jgi:hypothetical protein
MGFPVPIEWSLYHALLIQGIYFRGFIILANKRAIWRKIRRSIKYIKIEKFVK